MNNAPSSAKRYSTTAIALHWLLALALIGIFAFGLYMTPQVLQLAQMGGHDDSYSLGAAPYLAHHPSPARVA